MKKFSYLALIFAGFQSINSPLSLAALSPTEGYEKSSVIERLKNELANSYGGARIEIVPPVQWVKGLAREEVKSLSLLNDDGRGNIHFSVISAEGYLSEGWVNFRAWVSARIATRRLHLGDVINPENFTTQEANVAAGPAHEYRGVLFPTKDPLSGLEAIQTILEGQYLTSSAVRRIPDIRRGDSLQVKLISGDLILSTSGISEESGYINQQIRVRTGKAKKEISGLLLPGRQIEVRL